MSDKMFFQTSTPAEQGNAPLPDIDLPKLFEGANRSVLGPLPTLVDCGGVFFLTLMPTDRLSIATTIDRLIDMLDAMEADPDLEDGGDDEPWLGATVQHPHSSETIVFGQPLPPSGFFRRDANGSQEFWGSCGDDDREDEDEREPDQDDEYSLGWDNDGSQAVLRISDEFEPELGWPEQVDQVRRIQVSGGLFVVDGEPTLGFVGIGTGWRKGEEIDDREGDDEREHDHAEHGIVEFAESDWPINWTPKGGVQIAEKLLRSAKPRQKASQTYGEFSHRLPDGTIMRTFVAADDAKIARLPIVEGDAQ